MIKIKELLTKILTSLANKADISSVPTRTSQLTNDSNFITGTVTGNPPSIVWKNSTTNADSFIKGYDGGANGNNLVLNAGGNFIAGSGEYAQGRYNASLVGNTREDTYMGADQALYIESNGQTIANAKTWTYGTDGVIVDPNGRNLIPNVAYGDESGTNIYSSSIATGTTWVNTGSFKLDAGTFIIFITVQFNSNASGRRQTCVSKTSVGGGISPQWVSNVTPVNGAVTTCKIFGILAPTATTTYYVNAAQNSGGDLTVNVRYNAVKLM